MSGISRKGNLSRSVAWPKVVESDGGWRVDTLRGLPRRVRRFCASREELNALVEALRAERRALRLERGNNVMLLSALNDAQRRDVLAALDVLAGRGTLEAAARFYVKHAAPAQSTPIDTVVRDYIERMHVANRRERTIEDAAAKLRTFADSFVNRSLQSIMHDEIDSWLDKLCAARGWTGASRNAYRRRVHALFEHARKRGLIERNPCYLVEQVTVEREMPRILSVDETTRLLITATNIEPRIVPFFAIGLFAGLRPESELTKLDSVSIDLTKRIIRIVPETSKSRRTRFVDIQDNLLMWLTHYPFEGRIYYSRTRFREIVRASGIAWSRDVMRHSFASYLLAKTENAFHVALQLGHHGDTSLLFQHYRALVHREDAARYWSITPDLCKT